MTRIQFLDDTTGNFQEMHGSDGRANVSARSDERAYYNARDEKQTYTTVFDAQEAASGVFSAYWQNTNTTGKHLVISSIGVNAKQVSRVKLHFVTGTAASGTAITPINTNKTSSNDATANARQADNGGQITGLTSAGEIDFLCVPSDGHEEFRLSDRIRLGQNDAIALEYTEGASGDFFGVIFGYYE